MIVIKTLNDLEELKRKKYLDSRYQEYLEQYFDHFWETFGEGVPKANFSLADSTYIVLLEHGDDCNDLSQIDFDFGLTECCPEYVNSIPLNKEGFPDLIINQAFVLLNNEDCVVFHYIKGSLDSETEEFLNEYIINI